MLLHFWMFSGLKKVGALAGSAARALEVRVFKVP